MYMMIQLSFPMLYLMLIHLCLPIHFTPSLPPSLSLSLPVQRVCQDKVFPYLVFFAKGGGRTGTEPIRAYILTFFIAVACIAIGEYCTFTNTYIRSTMWWFKLQILYRKVYKVILCF